MAMIRPEMKVTYRTDASTAGWVIDVSGENARVFIDGSVRLVPVSELRPAPEMREVSPEDFRVALTRRRLEHPVTDQFLSYRASKTRLLYHQFLPVKKMLESPDQRLLIADEVGTGKTIEAGLIWAELESRAAHGLENVWIVCPKALVGKWQDEMLQRFDFRLEVLTPDGLRQALVSLRRDGILPPRFAKSVVNLELIRLENNLDFLFDSSVAWDLAIFDEAHHLRNTDTLSHELARLICERSKAAVFLTATPLQTQLDDIVHLMEALGVDVAADPNLLEEQLRWDMQLNDWIRLVRRQPPDWRRAADGLLTALASSGGRERPGWEGFRELAERSDLEDRAQRTVVVDSARDLQALSPYMTRTLRADVDEERPAREAITHTVDFSPEEAAFYNGVYEVCLRRALELGAPPEFITQMPERRTASCVPAVASEILRYSVENEDEEHEASFTQNEVRILEPLARAALQVRDTKIEALYEILGHAFGELKADRVMIFSTFRATLRYLADQLNKQGYSLELMYGPTPARDEDCRQGEKSRERIAAEFREGQFQILLASEVAGEGLDFEHCNVLINYDLPWNPMRIEQRIGRCDRLGQMSDKVYVGNLASVGTIEQRILTRLLERLHIFERALGELEVILGESIASFSRDLFRSGLTPQQQEERLERIAQVVENNEQHRESISQSNVISMQGRHLIDSDQQEIREAESRFLSPTELAGFVYSTIESNLPRSLRKLGSSDVEFAVIRNANLRDSLTSLLQSYPATHSARHEILRFRSKITDSRDTKVTFEGDADDAEFVHTRHPLVLLARHIERGTPLETPMCSGVVPASMVSGPMALVWAVGSLGGYTNRVELLCAAANCYDESVNPVEVKHAQDLMRAMVMRDVDNHLPGDIDIETLTTLAEQALLSQFRDITEVFNSRDSLLTEKAKSAVISHAERQLDRNRRRLSNTDLNNRLKNMYIGWNRRIETETKSKLTEITERSGVRSSLEIIGVALIHPDTPSCESE